LPSNAFNSFEDETCGKIDKPSPYTPTFNSFEDETKYIFDADPRQFYYAFNSFEDETVEEQPRHYCKRRDLSIPLRMKQYATSCTKNTQGDSFQFLWGWNVKLWNDTKRNIFFQFLWGWNRTHVPNPKPNPKVELSIPLRMKREGMWSITSVMVVILSIPLRMKHKVWWGCEGSESVTLSIPLRMKRAHAVRSLSVVALFNFQFLWGWNKGRSNHPQNGPAFNSFEDETRIGGEN